MRPTVLGEHSQVLPARPEVTGEKENNQQLDGFGRLHSRSQNAQPNLDAAAGWTGSETGQRNAKRQCCHQRREDEGAGAAFEVN